MHRNSRQIISNGSENTFCDRADNQSDVERLSDNVARYMTEAAFKEFPSLEKMSAAEIFEFGNVVTRLAFDFSTRVKRLGGAAENLE